MAELSEDDYLAILRNPLEQAVGHLRSGLLVVSGRETPDSQGTSPSQESENFCRKFAAAR